MYKLIIALLIVTFLPGCANRKLTNVTTTIEPARKQPSVVVTNWGKKAAVLQKGFWDKYSDTLIKQVGLQEYEYMKIHGPGSYPDQMVLLSHGNLKDPDSYYKKMSELKYELAARYLHFNDEGNYIGIYAILRVPYELNKNWDSTAKWDTVYFVIPMSALQVIN